MHMCIAFFVYLSLWGYALAALRARTHEPETAHSRACECSLIFRPPHTSVWAALPAEWPICSCLRKKINIHAYFCRSMLAHVVIYS